VLPFISTDDLAAFIGESVDGFELLTQIALDAGCQLVRDDLGQTINLVRGDIETHDGTGRESFLLNQLPVIDVASITEDDVELVPDDDYVVDYQTGLVHRRSIVWSFGWALGWPRRRQNVIVIYDHGWAITEAEVVNEDSGDEPIVDRVPSGIRLVALQAAARIYRVPTLSIVGSSSSSGTATSETIGSYSYSTDASTQQAIQTIISEGLSTAEQRSLDRYRVGNT
jgi:hypothetical protein